MDDQKSERLRQPPEQRFAGPAHAFDLEERAAKLQREIEAGHTGHRQETLYKHGPMSVSLFLFGASARLAPHRAKGVVTIHVLKGHLQVAADGRAHDLHAGHMLVLASGVEHDVAAREESRMLLTVHLDANVPHSSAG